MDIAFAVLSMLKILVEATAPKAFRSHLTLPKFAHPAASPSIAIVQVTDIAVLLRAAGFDLDKDIGASFEAKSPEERAEAYRLLQPYLWLFDEHACLAAMIYEHVQWLNPNPDEDAGADE